MIIQGNQNKLETNFKGASKKFGIGNAAKIIRILRDKLYSHKIRTLTQEYISNSRDAMREVGKGNEFEITVPTRLNPVFKVRDFGPGMTPDRVENVFIMYGSSTKEDTDEQTGGYGIGAKSAWSYTDSFTIVSFLDGVKRTYIAHTGTDCEGSLDLTDTRDTDEPNGVEIQVAVKPYDIEEFRSGIFRAIYFWHDRPVLKGELNPPTLVQGEVISDLVEVISREALSEYIRTGSYSDEALAIIDGIPYVITEKLLSKIPSLKEISKVLKKELVLHFGNGVVEVAASRESIDDSKRTLTGLGTLADRALKEINAHIAAQFAKVKDTKTYLQTYAEMSPLFEVDNFAKFGKYSIENGHLRSPGLKKVRITIAHCMNRSGRHRIDKVTKDEHSEGHREISVENFGNIFFSNQVDNKVVENKRIREFLKTKTHMVMLELLNSSIPTLDKAGQPVLDKEGKPTYTPVTYKKEFDEVITDLGAKDFQSITYVDPPKVVKAKVKREDAEICLHAFERKAKYTTYTTLAKNDEKWFYVPMKEGAWPASYSNDTLKEFDEYLQAAEGARICGLAERGVKMVSGDKNFTPLKDYLDNFVANKEVILAVKTNLCKNSDAVSCLIRLKDLEDESLTEMVKEYKSMGRSKVAQVPEIITNKVLRLDEIKEFKERDEKFGKTMKTEYPLVVQLGTYGQNAEEVAFYINAKFNK